MTTDGFCQHLDKIFLFLLQIDASHLQYINITSISPSFAFHPLLHSHILMSKRQYFQQISIDDEIDADNYYEDDHMEQFDRLLFDELLLYIKKVKFDYIIQNNLQHNDALYNINESHSLNWLFTADRKLIYSKTAYSFRFANVCHPELYQTFEIKAHHLFRSIKEQRHGTDGWYRYIGRELLDRIDNYLKIQRVIQNPNFHRTELFINQDEERLDIEFNFPTIKERIAITFEPGPPV
jgi:hypothetical protein